MNVLESRLKELDAKLYSGLEETKKIVSQLLQKYQYNFPTYTDHSIEHTQEVLNKASDLLTKTEIENLNKDEIYVLSMACILHDIGMCIPEDKIKEIANTEEILSYRKSNPKFSIEKYIRDIHHTLSNRFIIEEWQTLKIPSEKYAIAIGLVAEGHRKVNIADFDVYDPQFFVNSGRDFVCLPYLACIIRLSDELDITNSRTPELLFKYYMPDNEISQREWNKHKLTILVNFKSNKVVIEAKCTDHNILAALEEQFEKIRDVINNCQKIIRTLQRVENRNFSLSIDTLEPKFNFENFDPKGIKYTFDVKNVINAFIGEDLYDSKDVALRELIQNAIDSCNYKKALQKSSYEPSIVIKLNNNNTISIEDNGLGMDEFVIENYFGKLASSFYEQDSVKNHFESIGQFGIGVFSYFLIAEYIDVETKKNNKQALKFRTDKDPNGYFHFFKKFNRENEGTKITLHLKDDFKNFYTLDFICDYIQETFPFIPIPIFVSDNSEKKLINFSKVTNELNDEIYSKLYYNSKKYINDLDIITVTHKCEDYEGILAIPIPKNIIEDKIHLRDIFDYSAFKGHRSYRYSQILFAQKGVLINHYDSNLTFSFGRINLLKKRKLNLSRTNFTDFNTPSELLQVLVSKIIVEFFKKIPKKNSKNHYLITEQFRNIYYSYHDNYQSIDDAVKNNFCSGLFDKNMVQIYKTLKYVPDLFEKIIIIHKNENFEKLLLDISEEKSILLDEKVAFLKEDLDSNWGRLNIYKQLLNYGVSLIKIKNKFYQVLNKNEYKEYKETLNIFSRNKLNFDFIKFQNLSFAINLYDKRTVIKKDSFVFEESVYFNVNNNLNKTIINYLNKNSLNIIEKRLFNELYRTAKSFFKKRKKYKRDLAKIVIDLNSIITRINEESTIILPELKEKDFEKV